MRRISFVAVTLFLAVLLPSCASMKSTPDVTSLLTKQLGVTESQASGGVGSML